MIQCLEMHKKLNFIGDLFRKTLYILMKMTVRREIFEYFANL
jgi:hypothetical protein